MHLFEAEWFLPPLPSKRLKVETGGERWEPQAAAAQKELNKERKKTFGIDTVRPINCCQRFTAAVQPASYAGKTESSLYPPYKPVNEVRKYDEYAAFSCDYHMHTFRLGGGGGGVYESGWFGNFEIFWNCYLKNGAIQSLI